MLIFNFTKFKKKKIFYLILSVPTAQYLGNVQKWGGMKWYDFGGHNYSHKIIYLMIRSL